jgi:hypothetical protein
VKVVADVSKTNTNFFRKALMSRGLTILLLLGFVISGLQLTGCSSNMGIERIKWGHDGTYLLHEEHTWSLPDIHHNYLYISDLKLGHRTRIVNGNFDFASSPSSQHVVFAYFSERAIRERASDPIKNELAVMDLKSRRKILSQILESPWPIQYGWHPSGNAVYFTDGEGIKMWFLGEKSPILLVPHPPTSGKILSGSIYAVCWSDTGRLLAYRTGNGRFQKNGLYVLDTTTGTHSTIANMSDGLYGPAFFTSDARFLVYTTYLHRDSPSTVRKRDLSSGDEIVLWKQESDWITDLRRTRDGDSIVLQNGPMGHSHRTVQVLGNKGQSYRVPCEIWDYREVTDSFLCLETPTSPARIVPLSDLMAR